MENTILTEFVHDETRSEPEYPLYVWMALNRTADNTTFEWQPFKRPLNYINWEPFGTKQLARKPTMCGFAYTIF